MLTLISVSSRSQVVINEIMQSNIDCVMDETNQFPDSWVELYNAGTAAVPISGYKIGVSANPDSAWALPAIMLQPHSHTLIYCDKEKTGIHTDFRIDSGKGGALYLFKGGDIADMLTNIAKQPAPNIAYGRKTDGDNCWGYQATPTPGKPNANSITDQMLGEPLFSIPGQVFEENADIRLTLSLPEDAPQHTTIRYTLDGTEPTSGSIAYAGPIYISDTRVVRAKLFCDGYLSPRSTTQSYIVFPRTATLPVVSIVTDSDYLYDDKIGIYVKGTYSSTKKNYEYNWRRPINIELFEAPAQESKINQLCEARVAGAASRGEQLKSLALYANKRFDKKKFKYEFFPDQRPGETNYKSILLRNAGNDFHYIYMRDAICQRAMGQNADLDWQAWRPVVVYVNGAYLGILNIRERGNEENIYTNYDGLEDIDMIENWGALKKGDTEHLHAFKNFYSEHGHTWEEYSRWMDLDEYINYMAMNLYYNNVDFPANNLIMWRPRTPNGRWRFLAKDVDYALGIYGAGYDYQIFKWFYDTQYDSSLSWGNTSDGTRLFRRLMEDDRFLRTFTDRCAIYMGDFLNLDRVWTDIWQPMRNAIKEEYKYHRELINRWWPNYEEELKTAYTWHKKRTDSFYSQLADYYQLGTPVALAINMAVSPFDKQQLTTTVNGVSLTRATLNGKFFPGREITVTSSHAEKRVEGWRVTIIRNDGIIDNLEMKGETCTLTIPEAKAVQFNAVLALDTGIECIATSSSQPEVAIHDLRGISLSRLQRGVNIVKMSDGTVKKIIKK